MVLGEGCSVITPVANVHWRLAFCGIKSAGLLDNLAIGLRTRWPNPSSDNREIAALLGAAARGYAALPLWRGWLSRGRAASSSWHAFSWSYSGAYLPLAMLFESIGSPLLLDEVRLAAGGMQRIWPNKWNDFGQECDEYGRDEFIRSRATTLAAKSDKFGREKR